MGNKQCNITHENINKNIAVENSKQNIQNDAKAQTEY